MGVTRGGNRPRVSFRNGDIQTSDEEVDPPRLILQQGNNHQEDSSSDGEEQANSDGGNMVTAVRILPPQRHATEGAPVPVRPPTTAARTPPSPLLARNARRSLGQRQLWKKGRRSRQRFEEERRLLAQFVDQEDEEEAFTLVRESNSHFKSLLENKALLEKFVSETEDAALTREDNRRERNQPQQLEEGEERDPESAYLSICSNIRMAMKKHLPLGMVESLEQDITNFFTEKPDSVYVADDLSSYERLLAHACCSYNSLTSRSFDDDNCRRRKLRVENPFSRFHPTTPRLSVYLQERQAGSAVAAAGS